MSNIFLLLSLLIFCSIGNCNAKNPASAPLEAIANLITVDDYCAFLNDVASVGDEHYFYDDQMPIDCEKETDGTYRYTPHNGEGSSPMIALDEEDSLAFSDWLEEKEQEAQAVINSGMPEDSTLYSTHLLSPLKLGNSSESPLASDPVTGSASLSTSGSCVSSPAQSQQNIHNTAGRFFNIQLSTSDQKLIGAVVGVAILAAAVCCFKWSELCELPLEFDAEVGGMSKTSSLTSLQHSTSDTDITGMTNFDHRKSIVPDTDNKNRRVSFASNPQGKNDSPTQPYELSNSRLVNNNKNNRWSMDSTQSRNSINLDNEYVNTALNTPSVWEQLDDYWRRSYSYWSGKNNSP